MLMADAFGYGIVCVFGHYCFLAHAGACWSLDAWFFSLFTDLIQLPVMLNYWL
jgi:hypothetical protein